MVVSLGHPVEVTLQSIQVGSPELAERLEPNFDLPKGLGSHPVEAPLGIDRGLDESRLAKDAQMFRYGGLRHPESAPDLAHRLLGRSQETQNGATVRFGKDFECGLHSFKVPRQVDT
jgi:hypothetical protein